ncbi:hypothetical protein LTS08_001759 [Lithohypha guttulata]|nr:hypothetical protein LTS08_001759 [Lithohypha guttulata]
MSTTSQAPKPPRRFALLSASSSQVHDAPRLRGIVFDMDGTLCLPQNYMFKEMRSKLGIPKSVDILEHILSLSDKPDDSSSSSSPRSRAQEAIKDIEREAMDRQQPQPGLNELITYLAKNNLRISLCTRNFELPVKHLLEKFVNEDARSHFHPLVTREAQGIQPKPSPEGIWACVHAWDNEIEDAIKSREALQEYLGSTSEQDKVKSCEGVIMVGDSVDDIEAGARAGAATVLLVNEENKHLLEATEWPRRVDLSISRLDELADVLEKGFCGRD